MSKEREMYGIKILSNDEYNEYKGTFEEQIEELQERIDKAIEYIETYIDFEDSSKLDTKKELKELLDILKGNIVYEERKNKNE